MPTRTNQFKKFNPDQRCCQCTCGKKYRVTPETSIFNDNSLGSGITPIGGASFTVEGNIIQVGKRQDYFWSGGAGTGTSTTVRIQVGLIGVVVLKDGTFFVPNANENYGNNCDFLGIIEPGAFGQFYSDSQSVASKREVYEGGGLTRLEIDGDAETFSTDELFHHEVTGNCRNSVPENLVTSCARWDWYLAGGFSIVDNFDPLTTNDPNVIRIGRNTTQIFGYHSSTCIFERFLDPDESFIVPLGIYLSDRLKETIPFQTNWTTVLIPGISPPQHPNPGSPFANIFIPTLDIIFSGTYKTTINEVLIGEANYEEFSLCD